MDTAGRNRKALQEYIRHQLEDDQLAAQMSIKEYYDPFTEERNDSKKGSKLLSPLTGSKKT